MPMQENSVKVLEVLTVLGKQITKKCLKYAAVKSDFVRATSNDETIKSELNVDMSEIQDEQEVIEGEYKDVTQEPKEDDSQQTFFK